MSACVRCGTSTDGTYAFCAPCRKRPDIQWLIDPERWDEGKRVTLHGFWQRLWHAVFGD